jgi:hypothetical protein
VNETEASLPGPKVLLMGPSGTGKTHALGTLVDWAEKNKKEVFVLFTEAGLESLLGYWRDSRPGHDPREVPACLRWHNMQTRPLNLKSLITAADNVGKMSYEMLTKMLDGNRGGQNNAFWLILSACADFTDDRTGAKFGPVDTWGADKIFIIDSLSELANAAFKMQVGNKPTASPSDYGVSQMNLMNYLRLCTQGISATFILTAHIDRQIDEISGTTKIMVKAIGKALAGEIPQLFSDVILTAREGDKFYWDTAAYGVDCKTRSLGYRSKINPDFGQIMEVWRQRGGS